MLMTMFYFILALIILIIIHEYGHYIVARWCGVKVLRFSFGFGKVIFRWHNKLGTEFACSLVPLGGYVKMLDESEGEVPPHERHLAFNNKSVLARMAIVLAGPMFNFIFAFFALWLMWVIGIKTLAPMIGDVRPGSIAAKAGLQANQEIVTFAGKNIVSWRDFQYALMPILGSNEPIELTVKSIASGKQSYLILSLENWTLDPKKPDVLESLGIKPFIPTIPPTVGEVVANSPADKAGVKVGDTITSIEGLPISDWLNLVDFVKIHPDKLASLTLKRNGATLTLNAQIGQMSTDGQMEGFLGVRSQKVNWPANWLRVQREAPLQAMKMAFIQTIDLSGATFTLIGRLATGKLPLQSISGPVGIAQGAGDSGRSGLAYYLSFLALISISLGVLNLLPIPMLDGGHLLYCVIELIRRKPLSEAVKSTGLYVGLILLVALMIIAMKNDLSRLIG